MLLPFFSIVIFLIFGFQVTFSNGTTVIRITIRSSCCVSVPKIERRSVIFFNFQRLRQPEASSVCLLREITKLVNYLLWVTCYLLLRICCIVNA